MYNYKFYFRQIIPMENFDDEPHRLSLESNSRNFSTCFKDFFPMEYEMPLKDVVALKVTIAKDDKWFGSSELYFSKEVGTTDGWTALNKKQFEKEIEIK